VDRESLHNYWHPLLLSSLLALEARTNKNMVLIVVIIVTALALFIGIYYYLLQNTTISIFDSTSTSTATVRPGDDDSKLIVVLDLDECLVHVNRGRKIIPPSSTTVESFVCHFSSLKSTATTSTQQQQQQTSTSSSAAASLQPTKNEDYVIKCRVFLRPGWNDLLEHLLSQPDRYEVHIFTASEADYAKPILAELERRLNCAAATTNNDDHSSSSSPNPQASSPPSPVVTRFQNCWYRDSCRSRQFLDHTFTFKDLSILRRTSLHRTVLVDDDVTNFTDNPDHGIPVRPFRGVDANDDTLQKVQALLHDLASSEIKDVRPVLRDKFGIAETFREAQQMHSFVPKQWEHVMKYIQTVQL